jgi:hypothetical protein
MKKLKCLLLILVLSFSIDTEVYAQVSKQDAIDFVFDSIIMNRVDSVNAYMEPAILTDSYYHISPFSVRSLKPSLCDSDYGLHNVSMFINPFIPL